MAFDGSLLKKVGSTNVTIQPSEFVIDHYDVSASTSGRTEDGTMYKDSLGTCAKISLAYNAISGADANTILSLFQNSNDYYSITYFDDKLNDYRTATFYCGDRKSKCVRAFNGTFWAVSLNLVEQKPARY